MLPQILHYFLLLITLFYYLAVLVIQGVNIIYRLIAEAVSVHEIIDKWLRQAPACVGYIVIADLQINDNSIVY